MEEIKRRREAIRRYLAGTRPMAIYRALGRSKPWLYKWLKRYRVGQRAWAHEQSRAPHRVVKRSSVELERMVCAIRRSLITTKYAQKGALAIQWQLQQLGVQPLPPLWTINRILKRHGLVVKPAYQPRGTPYPSVEAQRPHEVQQLDLVGPRYLTGGSRFYGVHLIDTRSNAVALEAVASKHAAVLVEAIVAAWQRLGLPRILQLDNELSFRGSNRYPRSFGLLIRLCLTLGVEVVFIPEGEPWRNGIIERFNDVYDKLFFRSQRFRTLEHLRNELPTFERFHNTQHRYAKLGQRVPADVHGASRRWRLPRQVARYRQPLPWREGRVSCIRLTDEQGRVRFFGERFVVHPSLVHEYVTGTIDTKAELLTFTHQGHIVKRYKYTVTKSSAES